MFKFDLYVHRCNCFYLVVSLNRQAQFGSPLCHFCQLSVWPILSACDTRWPICPETLLSWLRFIIRPFFSPDMYLIYSIMYSLLFGAGLAYLNPLTMGINQNLKFDVSFRLFSTSPQGQTWYFINKVLFIMLWNVKTEI